MGKIADWIRIFDWADYLSFYGEIKETERQAEVLCDEGFEATGMREECVAGYYAPEDAGEGLCEGISEDRGRVNSSKAYFGDFCGAGYINYSEVYYKEMEEALAEKEAEGLYCDNRFRAVLSGALEAMRLRCGPHAGDVEAENLTEIFYYMEDGRYGESINMAGEEAFRKNITVFEGAERTVFEEGAEEIKVGERKKNAIIARGTVGGKMPDMKIEMNNVNNVASEVDIEAVTDMLTERLCDMMQKSAEGFYM